MRGVPIGVCMTCGHRVFPDRLLCSVCGGGEWRHEWVSRGVVDEVTTLTRSRGRTYDPPIRLASVQLQSGPRVIARLAHELGPGEEVMLDVESGAIVGHPVS